MFFLPVSKHMYFKKFLIYILNVLKINSQIIKYQIMIWNWNNFLFSITSSFPHLHVRESTVKLLISWVFFKIKNRKQ